jgi:hypothetical protein
MMPLSKSDEPGYLGSRKRIELHLYDLLNGPKKSWQMFRVSKNLWQLTYA